MLPVNRRVLVVDDNTDIHNDFRKILGKERKTLARKDLSHIEHELFDDDEDDDFLPPEPVTNDSMITYDLDFAFQGAEAIRMVHQAFEENRPYALVFMDVRMPPGIDGIETISRIWAEHPNVEMVICTAYSDYSFDGVLEKLGSTDRLLFLTKPFDSIAVKQMALSLSHKWSLHEQERTHVERLESEAAQRRASETRLHEMIHHDPLTNLANRRQLSISLDAAIAEARATHTRFAMFYIDLERFNEIIDTLGYQIGDKLLLRIADRLRAMFNSTEQLFRQGDSEFALLIPRMHSLQRLRNVAEKIHESFDASFDLEDLNVDIRTSVAIVIFPDHGGSADMLMRHADMALLYSRRNEKGYTFYDESMNKFSPERLMLLGELKNAILNDELLLYFLPKLEMKSEGIIAVEALIRWAHPTQGFVPPENFIPLAEQCGLIKPLTQWVINKVTRQWRAWADEGLEFEISINLGAQDLFDLDLAQKVRDSSARVKMPLNRIAFEVSEKAIMADREQASETLQTLYDLGSRITIDNFGTGHSSLAYLKHLPVHEIKIDRSFIHDLRKGSSDMAIVQTMVELGHNLGLQVSAEGVEDERSYQYLQDLSCDYAQGEFINAAVPGGELALWLHDTRWQLLPGKIEGNEKATSSE